MLKCTVQIEQFESLKLIYYNVENIEKILYTIKCYSDTAFSHRVYVD